MKQKIKIFSDGADLESFRKLASKSYIQGFTTNPTLMRKAGVKDYTKFAKEVLTIIGKKPISFEVFADDEKNIAAQAHTIKKWGENVYVKIPIVNSQGKSMLELIRGLHGEGIKLNITAILAESQLKGLVKIITNKTPSVISVFAGRIADTDRDPVPIMEKAKKLFSGTPTAEILWASVREVLNIRQASLVGADIITVPPEILAKYEAMKEMNLIELSRQTSEMFWNDAKKAGYTL